MFTLLQIGLIVLFWCGVLGGTLFVGRRYFVRSQMRRRMFEAAPDGGVIPGAWTPPIRTSLRAGCSWRASARPAPPSAS